MCEEIESATFTNLLLLGFDPVLMERKHATTFHRRMFRKANAKGMEIVLHFLIQRGFDQQCAQELALVWPIFDKPSARGFRKLATSLLQGLQESYRRIRRSLFHSLTVRAARLSRTCSGSSRPMC